MNTQIRKQILLRIFLQTSATALIAAAVGLLVNQVRSDRLPLVADWSPEARLTFDTGESMVISFEAARNSFFSQKAVFLDARSQESYQDGHIKGARNLPWEGMEKYFDAVMADIPKDALIITYCDGISCTWSKDLTLELFYRGYDNVRVLVDGWSLWVEHQLPFEKVPLPGGS